MSGYTGNPDAESEHALILAENGVEAVRTMLVGRVLAVCLDCGDPIPEARREFAVKLGHKCEYCIVCQADHDEPPKIKMLDRIL